MQYDEPQAQARVRSASATMQAIVQREYGGVEVLKQATAAIPSITEHEVLIEVHAGAVDHGTWYMMTGTPYLIRIMGFGLMRP